MSIEQSNRKSEHYYRRSLREFCVIQLCTVVQSRAFDATSAPTTFQ